MPSHLARGLYQRMLPGLNESMIFVSATKGLENHSLLRTSQVIREVVGTVPRRGDFRTLLREGSGAF